MRVLTYFLVRAAFDLAEVILLIRVFISWLPIPRDHRLVVLLYRITEPVLAPIRSMLNRSYYGRNMMFDFSPLVAFLILVLLRYIVLVIFF